MLAVHNISTGLCASGVYVAVHGSTDHGLSCRFNVYVAQPEVKPGCVLRRSNVRVLESRKLVSNEEVSNNFLGCC